MQDNYSALITSNKHNQIPVTMGTVQPVKNSTNFEDAINFSTVATNAIVHAADKKKFRFSHSSDINVT